MTLFLLLIHFDPAWTYDRILWLAPVFLEAQVLFSNSRVVVVAMFQKTTHVIIITIEGFESCLIFKNERWNEDDDSTQF